MLTSLPLFQQNENIFASKFPRTVLYKVIKETLGLGWISWFKSLKIAHFATFLVLDEVGFIIVKVSKKSSKKFSKKYSKKYSTFWVLFWVLKKVLKKVLLLNIAQKSAQKSAQKRDKLLKWDKFAQKSAQKSQIYSFLSRILKKVL